MRGQVSLEYLIVLGMIMFALIPLVYIANENAQIAQVTTQAKIAVNSFVSAANFVYSQGPGSRTTEKIFIPPGYISEASFIEGKVVDLNFYLANGKQYEVYAAAKGPLNGTLPAYWGYNVYSFTFNETGYVSIRPAGGDK